MKNKCLKLGLNFRHLHIPDHLFENERFKEIKYCYRCYAVNTHIANKCSKPSHYKSAPNVVPSTTFGVTVLLQWLNALTVADLTSRERLPIQLGRIF